MEAKYLDYNIKSITEWKHLRCRCLVGSTYTFMHTI